MIKKLLLLLITCLASQLSFSQEAIKDNSFLVEEAYNQEKGVIQHIFVVTFDDRFSSFNGSFTEEWPLGGEKHQLSLTLPFNSGFNVLRVPGGLLNYRYQLVHSSSLAIAPRASLLFPLVKESNQGWGYQLLLPVSMSFNEKLFIHLNAGYSSVNTQNDPTYTRKEEFPQAIGMDYAFTSAFNFVLELIHTNFKIYHAEQDDEKLDGTVMSPGFRFALNFKSGLHIVPGIAFPYEFTTKQNGYIFYLSFEHPFTKNR